MSDRSPGSQRDVFIAHFSGVLTGQCQGGTLKTNDTASLLRVGAVPANYQVSADPIGAAPLKYPATADLIGGTAQWHWRGPQTAYAVNVVSEALLRHIH